MLTVYGYCSRTQCNYLKSAEEFLLYCTKMKVPLAAESVNTHIENLRTSKGLAPRTVNQNAAAIKFFFEKVLKKDLTLKAVPRAKSPRPLPRIHAKGVVKKIINGARIKRQRLILMLVYGCGLRVDEIRLLVPTDLDLTNNRITIGEGEDRRIITIDENTVDELRRFQKNQ
jgi:integrase/recombinase XerD